MLAAGHKYLLLLDFNLNWQPTTSRLVALVLYFIFMYEVLLCYTFVKCVSCMYGSTVSTAILSIWTRRRSRPIPKIMFCGTGLDLLQSSGEFPCAVCHTGVGSNSIFCNGFKHLVHKKCNGLKRLTRDPEYRCTWCEGTARLLDGRPQGDFQVEPDKLEVVASFYYLGDMLSAAGGCELSTTTHVKTAWKKFKELLPVFSSRHLSLKTGGHVYSYCVRRAMLHASETWPLTKLNLQRL